MEANEKSNLLIGFLLVFFVVAFFVINRYGLSHLMVIFQRMRYILFG